MFTRPTDRIFQDGQIKNFKPFAGPANIPIKPITLIFGANSSGKSAIFQSLLVLKQTLEEGRDQNISLMPKGNLVDLGSFREFIHNHDLKHSFSFKMTFASPEDIGEAYGIFYSYMGNGDIDVLSKSIGSETLGLSVVFSWDSEASNIIIPAIKLYIGNDPKPIITYDIGATVNGLEFSGDFDLNHKYWPIYWDYFCHEDTEAFDNTWNDTQKIINDNNDNELKELKEAILKDRAKLRYKHEKYKRQLGKLEGDQRAIETYNALCNTFITLRGFLPHMLNPPSTAAGKQN